MLSALYSALVLNDSSQAVFLQHDVHGGVDAIHALQLVGNEVFDRQVACQIAVD